MSALLNETAPRLRPMTVDDVVPVMAVERAVYDFPWTEGIFRDCLRVGYSCWVVEAGDGLAGYAVMSVTAGEAHVLNLCIDPAYQRRRFGTRLLAHLMDAARRFHAEEMFLEVRPTNAPARRLYRQMHFEAVGRRKDYYPAQQGREDALILRRSLVEPGLSAEEARKRQ